MKCPQWVATSPGQRMICHIMELRQQQWQQHQLTFQWPSVVIVVFTLSQLEMLWGQIVWPLIWLYWVSCSNVIWILTRFIYLCFCVAAPVMGAMTTSPITLRVYVGENFTINCTAAYSCPPDPMITLSISGQGNPMDGQIMDITNTPLQTFINAVSSSSGTYTCTANNSRAVATFVYQVQVMPKSSKLITLRCWC